MDFRAVLIFLCLLTVQAVCGPARNRAIEEALNASVQEIQKALEHLDVPGVLSNKSCHSWNFSEVFIPEQQNLSAHHLSSFSCLINKVPKFTPELSPYLEKMYENIQNAEYCWTGQTVSKNCSLPPFEQHLEGYVYTKCLLQLVAKGLSKAKF